MVARWWQGGGKVVIRWWQGGGKVVARSWQGRGKVEASGKVVPSCGKVVARWC